MPPILLWRHWLFLRRDSRNGGMIHRGDPLTDHIVRVQHRGLRGQPAQRRERG
jgi:hypothetical protein